MDSNSDCEDLPYVVWYQCRMCTHLFFDDVEKMFNHLDIKHGAMIDCDELREIVYKNGLAMGGLPRVPKVEGKEEKEDVDEKINPVPEALEEAENIVKEELLIKVVATSSNKIVETFDTDEEQFAENGDYDDEYGESAYQNVKDGDGYYEENSGSYNAHDSQEQLLPEQKHVQDMNEDEDYDEYDNDYENDTQMQSSNLEEGEQYEDGDELVNGDYHEGHEEGEISAEISMNEDDSEDQAYENDEFEREQNGGNGTLPRNGRSAPGVMNYGYSCRFCGKFFTTRRGVESHEQHHSNQVPTHAIIGKRQDVKVFPCQICKRSLSSFKDLKAHVKAHTTDRFHICKFCYALFSNTANLTKHLTIHTRENPNKCFCGKTFVSANTLKIHKKIHTGIKPFVCNFYQCGRAFVTKSTLESHLRTHTGEKPYQCNYCASSFTTSSAKYRHERHVHKVPDPEQPAP
ncbi:unnamed protein product [Orchesella dallaii]|uniref:Zinc finger protein n=1 Tax=Orchesella dallaii TaxID=48710 RepID=A0ABP1PRW8_9HEXA